MDLTLAGFIALAALIIGLFAWLRQDIRELRRELAAQRTETLDGLGSLRNELSGQRTETLDGLGSLRNEMSGQRTETLGGLDLLRNEMGELRERVARIEGLLEAMFMRRDLTPFPEPPPPGDRPDKSRAA